MLPDCDHLKTEIRERTFANGSLNYQEQCLLCGGSVGNFISKLKIKLPVPKWDQSLVEKREREWHDQRKAAEKERLEQQQQWWVDYNRYLLTPEWHRKRTAVLRRDGYTCQACLANDATQVHHKTYEHLFNEPLFDLVAVCGRCHDKITAMDRERRGGGPTKLTVEDFGLPVQEEVETHYD